MLRGQARTQGEEGDGAAGGSAEDESDDEGKGVHGEMV
jgi:hypothetical protein